VHVKCLRCDCSDRATVETSLQGVLDILAEASKDVEQLVGHVGAFSSWWLQMKGSLQSLLVVIPKINSETSNRLRTVSAGHRWKEVKRQCQSYSNTVHPILQMNYLNGLTSNLFAAKGSSIAIPSTGATGERATGECPNAGTAFESGNMKKGGLMVVFTNFSTSHVFGYILMKAWADRGE
jgi:hypothetical protein